MPSTREVNFDPVFGSQETFRLLLDAMSRPGKVVSLPASPLNLPAPWPTGLGLVALTLLDHEVTHCATGAGAEALQEYLQYNTSSPAAEPAAAAYLFAHGNDPGLAACLAELKTGTLEAPHEGATLVVAVSELSPVAGRSQLLLTLSGPGVPGERLISVAGLSTGVLVARAAAATEYPLGIDVVLIDQNGRLACLPRTTRCHWEERA